MNIRNIETLSNTLNCLIQVAKIIEAEYPGLVAVGEVEVEGVPADDPTGRWYAVSQAFRSWAIQQPQQFALIFGAPVPGFEMPQEGPVAEACTRAITNLKAFFVEAYEQGKLGPPLIREVDGWLSRKQPGEVDGEAVLLLKRRIREVEAVSAVGTLGIAPEQTRFLNLPFYQTGNVRKDPIGERDVEIIHDLLAELRPEIILVAGDFSDPHGTHRMCKEAVERAYARSGQ